MSVLGRYKQQPGERRKRGIDYTSFLETNEEIDVVTVKEILPVTDPPLVTNSIVASTNGKLFTYFVSGGVDGTDYTVTFSVQTTLGQIREDEIEFEIVEE
jgi:hypothetical protein